MITIFQEMLITNKKLIHADNRPERIPHRPKGLRGSASGLRESIEGGEAAGLGRGGS